MKLKTERSIKFWLTTIAKIAFIVLIVFKIYDFVISKKSEDRSENKVTVKNDSLNSKAEIIDKELPLVKNKPIPQTKLKKEASAPTKNSIYVLIYNSNGIDYSIANHLENTVFQKYNLSTAPSEIVIKKNEFLVGNFSALKKTKPEFIVTGEVDYSFKKGSQSSNTISCQINLQFSTYSTITSTKQRDLSKSIQVNGIGFTEEEAKANAIKKI